MPFRRYGLILIGLLLLAGCQQDPDAEEVETVEGFSIEESEEIEGYYETVGYMQVNSITYHKMNRHVELSAVLIIEDYYDLNHQYLRTELVDTHYEKSKLTDAVKSHNNVQEAAGPLTIHIPPESMDTRPRDLNEEQLAEIRAHIFSVLKDHGMR
ncbi:hypothetical protein [Paenibacillus sp. 1P07SE]|uniref:hypothetical protein n=1 Tax=Paenibacillus sp. 1P07SE TaxID=3132209 RepID=UPI0039A67A66